MARKSVKKRKQQRTSVKRKTKFFKAKPVFVKKPKPFNPVFDLKIGTPEDPFFIHPETIPDGVALQWIAFTVKGDAVESLPFHENSQSFVKRAIDSGWNPVKDQKSIGGQVLMWARKEVADGQRKADFERAREQIREDSALFGLDEYGRCNRDRGTFPLVSPSFIASTNYASVPDDSPSIDVYVTIKVRISARWQNAAACLGLDPQEYARRRLIMEPTVLGPCSRAYIYENVSDPSCVYEPVELFTKRID